jgi:hypothetical protein
VLQQLDHDGLDSTVVERDQDVVEPCRAPLGLPGQKKGTRWPLFFPVLANLTARAQDWPWSSVATDPISAPALDPGSVPRPPGWLEHVNTPQTEAEVEAVRECIRRRRAYGDVAWMVSAARQLGLEASVRPRGRPRKRNEEQPPLFGPFSDPR